MLLKNHTHKQALQKKEAHNKTFFSNLLCHNTPTFQSLCHTPSVGQQHSIPHNILTELCKTLQQDHACKLHIYAPLICYSFSEDPKLEMASIPKCKGGKGEGNFPSRFSWTLARVCFHYLTFFFFSTALFSLTFAHFFLMRSSKGIENSSLL